MKQQTGSKLGKEYGQGYISSLCLFNLYTEYIVQNTRLGESQGGIKIAKRNINNLNMQMTPHLCQKTRIKEPLNESEREEWKSWLKTQHSEN